MKLRVTPALVGEVHPVDDFSSAEQTALTMAFGRADNIAVAMNAVGHIHIEAARRAEHRSIAWGAAIKGMRGLIFGSEVGFDLGDANGDPIVS